MKVAKVNGGTVAVRDSLAGIGGATPVPAMGDLSDVVLVGLTDGDVLVWDDVTDTWVPGAGSGGSLWFNVMDYGAVGDGAADDTTAVNLAIAALNTAARGVLYFPAGVYKVTAALTTITAAVKVLGDGGGRSDPNSKIDCTNATATLFTVSSNGAVFEGLLLENSHATPSAGSAITTTGGAFAFFLDCAIVNFWVGVDIENSSGWTMRGCYLAAAARHWLLRIRNTALPDTGDWSISDTYFAPGTSDAAIRIETSGGGKIVNCKVNGNTAGSSHGIDLHVAGSTDTGLLQITNTSIENVGGDAIHGTTSAGTSKWGGILLTNVEVALYSNNTGRALNLVATTAGDFHDIVIGSGCLFITNGTARAAIAITNVDEILISPVSLDGFNAVYTSTTSTNIVDGTGTIAGGVAVTGTPSSGQVPTATSGTAATWQTPSSGASALDDLTDVTITTPVSGDRVRYNGSLWVNSALRWEPHVAYDGTVVLDGNGDPVMVEVS